MWFFFIQLPNLLLLPRLLYLTPDCI